MKDQAGDIGWAPESDNGTVNGNRSQRPEAGKLAFPIARFRKFGHGLTSSYVVKNLIPQAGLVVVWGSPKCGKSFWATDLGMHIALGWAYRGHKVRQGTVVYLALEGEAGFKNRRDAFAARFFQPGEDPPFYLMTTQIDLRRQAGTLVEDIRAQLGKDRPTVLVIDTLNRSLVGSESKDEDMTDYVRAADMIRAAFGCAVIIVHHCGINGERPRGHTSLTGAADAQLAVRRDESGRVLVTVEYMKDGDFGEVIGSRLEVVELEPDEDGDPVTSCVIVAEENIGQQARQKMRLPPAAAIAFDALREALAESGTVPPASNHIPDNVRAVAEKTWRDIAYRRGISDSEEPEARKKAFQRARSILLARKVIATWDNWTWTV